MTKTQNTTNPLILPDDLPRPIDDGGADHLAGMKVPSVRLRATSGDRVDLSEVPGGVVVYAYPMTGVPGVELPSGWNDIPGARGCTPQTLSFQAEKDVFAAFGVTVFGLSTQTADYQKELSDRLDLSFPILSDAEFELSDAMRLPTMVVEGMRLIKRLTLVLKDGVVEHVFYPVFPPNRSAADVIAWLQENTAHAHGPGVLIYTTPDCPHCRAAKTLLKEKGVAYVEVDVDRDPEAAHVMVARSEGRRTVPQIFIGPTHIGGGDDLAALEAEARLDTLLVGTKE
ncbi:glutaredoxin 3 [Roseibium sp.]|uniref:glutaredoxin 3 n=1 Tax=Roseibium sp. TaxID=1936156 RepID=UPI003B513406